MVIWLGKGAGLSGLQETEVSIGAFSIRFFVGNGKPKTANCHVPRPCGHVCSLKFTFEPQEGLPAVSDLRQGFLPQKIVQPRV